MLLKISGCAFVVIATTLMGVLKAEDIREQYRQMRYLQRIIYMMESEIRYAHAHLGEVFLHISRQVQEPYKSWLLSMKRDMDRTDAGTFEKIWRQAVKGHLEKSGLPEKEVDRLMQLGGQFGTTDIKLQLKVLELYQEQLGLSMEEAWEGIKERVRLCHCLGVMSGMLIVVLLI